MEFEWDSSKNISNIEKHGISFLRAARVFDGPILKFLDDRKDYGETRYVAIGIVEGLEYYVVSFLAEGQIEMKEENIVRYTLDRLPEDTESDMARVESMTEADIEEAARSDPDAQPTDDKFLSKAQIVLSIPLDQDTFKWYQSRGKNIETTVQSVLHEYKKIHQVS